MRMGQIAEQIAAFMADWDPYGFRDAFDSMTEAVNAMIGTLEHDPGQVIEFLVDVLDGFPNDQEMQTAATLIMAVQSIA